jgi:glycine C-acetyltransferase
MSRTAPTEKVTKLLFKANQAAVFEQHLGTFIHPRGPRLIERTKPLGEWIAQRTALKTWPYTRVLESAPIATTKLTSPNKIVVEGINFGSQDYLGLSSHPAVHIAALEALREYGPHTASSPALQGNTQISRRLEESISEFLCMEHVLLFPTGWAAGFGTIVGLVRQDDHVVIDRLAHACLVQGAAAATKKISYFKHNDNISLRRRLQSIRAKDSENSVLVVTEGLFSMDSDSPDIFTIQGICREFDAILLVDVAHDLGASGPNGTGQTGIQKMLGEVDLIMGSFSKAFASNGGFLACHDDSVKQFVGFYGGPHTFSNALSPIQAGIVNETLRIVRSPEGDLLRKHAMQNINRLRDSFQERGLQTLGEPSNVVMVCVGDESLAKVTSGFLEQNGLLANLVEFPAVAKGKARFRFQVMATHSAEQIDEAVEIFSRSLSEARQVLGWGSAVRGFARRSVRGRPAAGLGEGQGGPED